MLKQIEGSRAMAEGIALCRPEVVCAYPITPQTHIVEGLGEMVCTGELKNCEFINVGSRNLLRSRSQSAPRRPARVRIRPRDPGPAVHGGSRLQRFRARTADRHDAR